MVSAKKVVGAALAAALCAGLAVPAAAVETTSRPIDNIVVSDSTMAVVKADGTLWTWGDNYYGTIGAELPDDVREVNEDNWVDKVYHLTPYRLMSGVLSVTGDSYRMAAVKNDHSLWVWGIIDARTRLPYKLMDDVDKMVSSTHTAVLKTDGSLWMWGDNDLGQIGNGEYNTSDDYEVELVVEEPYNVLNDVKDVAIGRGISAAIKSDGSLWMWGTNDASKLGLGHTYAETDGYRDHIVTTPQKVMDDVKKVFCGDYITMAIKNDGTLWAWGSNRSELLTYAGGVDFEGMVDDSFCRYQTVPKQIMEDVKDVSGSGGSVLALKEDGSVWAWGSATSETLGDGVTGHSDTPIFIMDDVAALGTGYNYSVIKNDGSLWYWGYNSFGQAAQGTTSDSIPAPVKVMDGVLIPGSEIVEKPSAWAENEVNTAVAAGIVPDSMRFGYKDPATRAEFCALAVKVYEQKFGEITERKSFADTSDVNVEKMAAIGVVDGVGNEKFAPDMKLSREQAATILSRLAAAMNHPLPEAQPDFKGDGHRISGWAKAAVGQMQKNGIMKGTSADSFSPKGSYTKEQSILTAVRLMNFIG